MVLESLAASNRAKELLVLLCPGELGWLRETRDELQRV